jgi:hypothetical protein
MNLYPNFYCDNFYTPYSVFNCILVTTLGLSIIKCDQVTSGIITGIGTSEPVRLLLVDLTNRVGANLESSQSTES